MARIPVEIARDPTRCGADLIEHKTLGGLVCPRCGYYYDDRYLSALGLWLPLTCGNARAAGASN